MSWPYCLPDHWSPGKIYCSSWRNCCLNYVLGTALAGRKPSSPSQPLVLYASWSGVLGRIRTTFAPREGSSFAQWLKVAAFLARACKQVLWGTLLPLIPFKVHREVHPMAIIIKDPVVHWAHGQEVWHVFTEKDFFLFGWVLTQGVLRWSWSGYNQIQYKATLFLILIPTPTADEQAETGESAKR